MAKSDTPLFERAPFYGIVRLVPEPLTYYRRHGTNASASMTVEFSVRREVRFYEDSAAALARYVERIGIAVDLERWSENSWYHRHLAAIEDIGRMPAPGTPFILVDDRTWEVGPIAGRQRIHLEDREGECVGAPEDDDAAISAFTKARAAGATLIVFAWSAFWWLQHYPVFHSYLRTHFECVQDDARLLAFDIRHAPD